MSSNQGIMPTSTYDSIIFSRAAKGKALWNYKSSFQTNRRMTSQAIALLFILSK